jgi:hypothetical protein
MVVGQCCAVEEWAPVFVYYAGTTIPKYNDTQIEALIRQGGLRGWCNIGDAPMEGNVEQHVRAHMRELRDWRARRQKEQAKQAKQRLGLARRERQMARAAIEAADVIAHASDYPDDDEEE